MKIFFLVQTYVKPNLVLTQIPFMTGGGGGEVSEKLTTNQASQ